MRFVLILALTAFVASPAAFAAKPAPIPDAQQLSAMAAHAAQAKPKDRCYLYAKLIRAVSRVIGRDVRNGDEAGTSSSLKAIRSYTAAINQNVSRKAKKLVDAQVILRQTAFRLNEMRMSASLGQQTDFQTTVSQVNQVQSHMMLTVFQK